MSEATGTEKKAIMQQASAIFASLVNQEQTITFLRTLDLPADDAGTVRVIADLIESLHNSRQQLVDHFEFLGVAFDHGWDAAHIYREDPPEDTSKRVLNAVSKARKKKEADEREKKKKKNRSSSSSGSGASKRRRDSTDSSGQGCSHSHASSHCCPPQWQPYHKQFRAGQNLPCIRCGDTAHHWRQCPKPTTK